MKQLTLAAAGFERYAKTTRRATFLAEMEQVRVVASLVSADRAGLPEGRQRASAGRVGADAADVLLQHWFNLLGCRRSRTPLYNR